MTVVHISQFNIQQVVTERLATISQELTELQAAGMSIPVTALELFQLEALGLVLDFETGMLHQEVEKQAVVGIVFVKRKARHAITEKRVTKVDNRKK